MNEWEQEEGEGGGVGVGVKDEQTQPILIPGQAGVHSCCCSHSRAWIWLGKGSINLLMLQQAAYSGAAVRNALSCVCVCWCDSPLPLRGRMRAHMCACVEEGGVAVHKQYACKHPCKHPGKEVSAMGRRASLLRCGCVHLAAVRGPRSICAHSGLTRVAAAGGRCVHTKWVHMCRPDLGAAPPPFPLKAGKHNPSPHPGGIGRYKPSYGAGRGLLRLDRGQRLCREWGGGGWWCPCPLRGPRGLGNLAALHAASQGICHAPGGGRERERV